MEILSVASRYRNRDKLWPAGPLGSNADLALLKQSVIVWQKLHFFYIKVVQNGNLLVFNKYDASASACQSL